MLPKDWKNEYDFGPYIQNNDFGACCKFIPHFNFEPFDWGAGEEAIEIFHQLVADARNGEAFGLDMIVNTEQFNYGFREANSAGKMIYYFLILPFQSQASFVVTVV